MGATRHLIDRLFNKTNQPGDTVQTAAMLAVALEEIERTARSRGLNEVAHFAGVARLAAWERTGAGGAHNARLN